MNPSDIVRTILKKHPDPPSPRRADHGGWLQPAQAVHGLVQHGWGVTDAVRHVIEELRLTPADRAAKGIRAAYYANRNKTKP